MRMASDLHSTSTFHSRRVVAAPMQSRPARVARAAGLALLLAACSGTSATTPAASRTIIAVAGDNQTWLAGQPVPIPPAVKVADADGAPLPGVTVTFVTSDGGTVSGPTPVTDSNGIATVGGWTLGVVGSHLLLASVPQAVASPVTFTATAVDAATITINAGNDQSAPAGSPVPLAPSVRVVDVLKDLAPLRGVTVTFTVVSGGGSVSGGVTTTDSTGVATVGSWSLGAVAGDNQLQAQVNWPGAPFVRFRATGTPPSIREP